MQRFHPFGPEWESHVDAGENDGPLATGIEILSGRSVLVPVALVNFPVLVDATGRRPTRSHTAGLAVHPSRDEAIVRALLEVLERDDLYPNFLSQCQGHVVEQATSLRTSLSSAGYYPRIVCYHPDRPIKIVHAFCVDPENGAMLRGSGSALSMAQAVDGALSECVQLAEHARAFANDPSTTPYEWIDSDIVHEVASYLDRMEPWRAKIVQEVTLGREHWLPVLLKHLVETDREAIIVDLECPIADWTAVRALVPGACCHQYVSSSDGGRLTRDRIFAHPIPN